MRVAFRVDASHRIGSGHVMRCLSLADELRRRGDDVVFVARAHRGDLRGAIEDAGFRVCSLDAPPAVHDTPGDTARGVRPYAAWLGVAAESDAAETAGVLEPLGPLDWLVVDHYALDDEWERRLRPLADAIAVIDDLADRRHDTDILVDPTLGREPSEYRALLPKGARALLGPGYAPLRCEFAALRPDALARRGDVLRPRRLLVNLGGADPDGATVTALAGLAAADLPSDVAVEVILGASAVDSDAARRAAEALPCAVEVAVGVPDLADRMARADLAVGAAGTTAWERCCLGLPAVVVTIADNQRRIAGALEEVGAIQWLGDLVAVTQTPERVGRAVTALLGAPGRLGAMVRAASGVADGLGAGRVADALHAGASGSGRDRVGVR